MHDVFYMPNLHSELFSVSKLILKGLNVHFNTLGCMVRVSSGEMLAIASFMSNLYQLDTNMMTKIQTIFFGTFRQNLAFYGALTQDLGVPQCKWHEKCFKKW